MSTGYPEDLYIELTTALEQIKLADLPEEKAIEKSFALCMRYEQKLLDWLKDYQFPTETDEIHFFKHTKPLFGAQAHFFKLRYQFALFRPKEIPRLSTFYEYELFKLDSFLAVNAIFYQYLKSGATDKNREYLLQIMEENSGEDQLAGRILGVEMYREYLTRKIFELKCNYIFKL
jgi:hypothetical protein